MRGIWAVADDGGLTVGLTPKKEWHAPFLKRLCETANVSAACRRAKISRVVAYEDRKEYPEFAAAWEEALEIATEALELEARRRAERGVLDPVYQGGVKVGTVRKYSDTLLIFLLKAHKPEKYADRRQHSGPDGGPIAFTGALATYELGADEAGTIFDELAAIGAFKPAPDDAKAE